MTYCRQCDHREYDHLTEQGDCFKCDCAVYVPETEEDLRNAAGIADYYRDKEN